MSQENLGIIRRLVAAWNRQDLDGILALTDPEAEYVNAPSALEPGTRRGHDALVVVMRKQWEDAPPGGALQEIDRFHERGDEIITEGRLSRAMPGSDDRISPPSSIRGGSAVGNSSGSKCSEPVPNFLTPSKPPGCRSSAATIRPTARP